MANELTLSASVSYEKGNVEEISRAISSLLATVSGSGFIHNVQAIGTSEEALNLAAVTIAGGWAFLKNLDDTNYLEVRSGTGASNDIIRLNAGEFALLRWGSDITAPYAIANTAECLLEYIFWPA